MLDEPELTSLDAGIVLQAYLPDSHAAFERLAGLGRVAAGTAGGGIKVRLVKGANLAMERVDAELHGWPQAPYPTKAEVDASYKRLLDRALDPAWGDGLRVGLGSHNIFDVAWGMVRADRLGTADTASTSRCSRAWPRARPGLLGVRPAASASTPRSSRHDEFDAAIAYLVRRLDENTSPDNFLRDQFELRPGSTGLQAERDRFAEWRRRGARSTSSRGGPRTARRSASLRSRRAVRQRARHRLVAPANRAWLAPRSRRRRSRRRSRS